MVAAYGTNGQVRKRKNKKQSYARVKIKDGWDKIPSQNKIVVFMNTQKLVYTGLPHELIYYIY